MLKRKIGFVVAIAIVLLAAACKSGADSDSEKYERKIGDSIRVDAIMQGHDIADTTVIGAYLDDKSTISINDIDSKDTTYSVRVKNLYTLATDHKVVLAIAFGFKNSGQPGMAVVQFIGKKPATLKEGKMEGSTRNYTDGTTKLQYTGDFVFIDGVQYVEVK